MKYRAFLLALVGASIALPGGARAADDLCSRLIIQAVNQFCQLLPNGLNLCQPVALVGPNPQCDTAGSQTPVPVPLGPATLRPPAPWAAPYASAWPATQTAAHIPLSERASIATPASPVAPTPPTPPRITPEAAKPIAAAAVPIAATAAPVASAIAPIIPVATPPQPPVAAITSATPASQGKAAPAVEPPPTPAPAAPATAVPTALPGTPPTVPDLAPSPATGTVAETETVADALAHFDFDSAILTPVGRAVLDAWLTEAPRNKSVRVSGYADRLGPEPYNLKLSLRRAEAVKQYLSGKGFDTRRIQLEAKGEAEPVKRCKGGATAATKACLAPNRRVRIDPE